MRKNVGVEENLGLRLFCPCFLNILNRGIETIEILWKIKTSKIIKIKRLSSCFTVRGGVKCG